MQCRSVCGFGLDDDSLGGRPGGLSPGPMMDALESVVAHLAFDDPGIAPPPRPEPRAALPEARTTAAAGPVDAADALTTLTR